MRWLSPPDSVPELRDSERYSSPTSFRKRSRSRISFRMRTAISFCLAFMCSGNASNQSRATRIDICVTSPMCSLSILTASASGFRRKPLQAGQGAADM